jgi:aspartokinase/homoserine dehydrogenase 1
MLLDEKGLDAEAWRSRRESAPAADFEAFAKHMEPGHWPYSVVIDCTASDAVAEKYTALLARGIHVVTPNKKAGAGPIERYREIQRLVRASRRQFLYEATVGAGLPVISTLRDLVRTGDRVERIEGVLSGTLSYVFHRFDGSQPFSAIVRDAKERGYTEPDPRDDLSGMDVARKLVILAREMGVEIQLADVAIENLVPESLRASNGADAFLEQLASNDAAMEARRAAAAAKGEVLRYVGVVDAHGVARVELRGFAKSHPFAGLAASDNIIAFTTSRYSLNPLIVQGPGAGPDVTASGVFADLLRLVSA